MTKLSISPSIAVVNESIKRLNSHKKYTEQESALDKLFLQTCPKNDNLDDILIKVSTLNDFYSTNLRGSYFMAKHIHSLKIDERLRAGDLSLVREIADCDFPRGKVNCYSFASKYCSHHEPLKFAIYDRFVAKILMHFQGQKAFAKFKKDDLKNYENFIAVIKEFQRFFGLEQFSLKQIDQYLWQVGKQEFAPNKK